MRNLISKLAIPLLSLALIMPGVSEAAPSPGAKARFPVRPTNIPADYVPTPFGLYVSSKCVIFLGRENEIPNFGFIISYDRGIMQPDRTYKPVPACTLPRYNRDGSIYKGAELMDTSTGNHDLIISYESAMPVAMDTNLTYPPLASSNPPFPAPKTILDQTIFLTNGMTSGNAGWLQFWAFNMQAPQDWPPLNYSWRTGSAFPNINGNVIIVFDRASGWLGNTNFAIGNDTEQGRADGMYRGQPIFNVQGTAWTQYYSPTLLSKNTLLSMQAFNVTSCDMLPDTTKILGNAQFITKFTRNADPVSPTVWSSGLCNLAATTSQNTSNPQFTITYDTSPTPKGRSAKITFVSE